MVSAPLPKVKKALMNTSERLMIAGSTPVASRRSKASLTAASSLSARVFLAVGRTLAGGLLHAFVVVTLRPSMRRYVVDPAWGECCTPLDVAFFGSGWGHDRRLEAMEGELYSCLAQDIDLPQVTA